MNSSLGDLTPSLGSLPASGEKLESRVDHDGITTFHLTTSDRQSGISTEKIFDQNRRLVKVTKRNGNSQSETHYDANTGAVARVFEVSVLPDGSTMTKEVSHASGSRSTERVKVVAPNGDLVRRVERHHVGMRTIFQGQTEYVADGLPSTTVNHYMDMASGRLLRREQIEWIADRKSLTESIHFDAVGFVARYVKVIFHSAGGPFLEEKQEFYSGSHAVRRREVSAYAPDGLKTCQDIVEYGEDGEIIQRSSTFFDSNGNATASRRSFIP